MANNSKTGTGLKVAAAVAGAAAAGYYFYASKDAKNHRKIAAKWATEMKSEVMKKAKALKNVDRKTYESIVTNAQKAYVGIKSMDRAEVERAAKELKSNWDLVAKEFGKNASAAKKTVKTAAKKSVKTVKKAAKKMAK